MGKDKKACKLGNGVRVMTGIYSASWLGKCAASISSGTENGQGCTFAQADLHIFAGDILSSETKYVYRQHFQESNFTKHAMYMQLDIHETLYFTPSLNL